MDTFLFDGRIVLDCRRVIHPGIQHHEDRHRGPGMPAAPCASSRRWLTTSLIPHRRSASEDGATNVADNKAPFIHNVRAVPSSNAFCLSWNTDAEAKGGVNYGTTASYGNSVGHADLRYAHLATVPGLTPSTLYHYDLVGSTAVGPLGDHDGRDDHDRMRLPASMSVQHRMISTVRRSTPPCGRSSTRKVMRRSARRETGFRSLFPPVPHTIMFTTDTAPKLLQNVPDQDLQYTVKFSSPVTNVAPQYQIQGLVFVQDSMNMLRFDFSNSATGTQLLAIGFINGLTNPVQYLGQDVAAVGISPSYIRVSRSGSYWILEYSFNGTSWTQLGTFYHVMTVAKAGVWAGNEGTNPPAFTSLAEWFKAALPARPALLAPTNAAQNVLVPPTATWDSTTAAASFRVQVASDTTFGTDCHRRFQRLGQQQAAVHAELWEQILLARACEEQQRHREILPDQQLHDRRPGSDDSDSCLAGKCGNRTGYRSDVCLEQSDRRNELSAGHRHGHYVCIRDLPERFDNYGFDEDRARSGSRERSISGASLPRTAAGRARSAVSGASRQSLVSRSPRRFCRRLPRLSISRLR